MAKKRKVKEPAEVDDGHTDSRKRIRTYEDVADSDDDFHLNRDRILLEEEPSMKRQRKLQEEEAFLDPSDEEILEDSAKDYQDELRPETTDEEEQEEEDEEGWGVSRADVYGADTIETEEQALEEEAEARRLQRRQLQSMSAADYGFDENDWKESNVATTRSVVIETLPVAEIPTDATSTERLKMLKQRYPEFEPLSKELLHLDKVTSDLARALSRYTTAVPILQSKYHAASAYLAALTMYFALLTSGKGVTMPANELRDHDIMESLVECKTLWTQVKTLPDDKQQDEHVSHEVMEEVVQQIPAKKSNKSRKERHADAVQAAKAARLAEKLQRTEAENAELDDLVTSTSKRKTRIKRNGSDLGEEVPLTMAEAEEKARRRKSLRFYTSQIAQKVNKRGTAGRTAGGDDDIPHRERLKDRQARLNAEAEKRGRKQDIGDDLGGDSDEGDADQARRIREEGDEDYYDMIAAKTAKKKSDKAAYAEAQRLAAEQGGVVVEEAVIGTDGKRKVTYAIEKNKGLTPHRRKEVRNPRVKKRKKFEAKTKKLATMKATYKGGEGRGGYGGELTGIKANLVKSTKL